MAINRHFTTCIFENARSSNIDVKENSYIQLLRTLRPVGMNIVPLGRVNYA